MQLTGYRSNFRILQTFRLHNREVDICIRRRHFTSTYFLEPWFRLNENALCIWKIHGTAVTAFCRTKIIGPASKLNRTVNKLVSCASGYKRALYISIQSERKYSKSWISERLLTIFVLQNIKSQISRW